MTTVHSPARRRIVGAYRTGAYFLTLSLFGLFALVLGIGGLGAACLPRRARTQRFLQRTIHRCFRLFIGWMEAIRVCRVRYDPGFGEMRRCGGAVVAANHPGLMDVTYLLAQFPEAFCIFKPAIRRNPLLGVIAVRAGYLASSDGVDAIRTASARIAAGEILVVFPEGTRTPPGRALGALHPGFALIARHAAKPIRLVRIRCDSNVLTKGCRWWKPPSMPVNVRIELGPRIDPADAAIEEVAAAAERWWTAGAGAEKPPSEPVRAAPDRR